jgi:hypothetical protein
VSRQTQEAREACSRETAQGKPVILSENIIPLNTLRNTLRSTLALLVARVAADHPDNTLAPDYLALAADLLHRCHYFHFSPLIFHIAPIPNGPARHL